MIWVFEKKLNRYLKMDKKQEALRTQERPQRKYGRCNTALSNLEKEKKERSLRITKKEI